MKLPTLTFTAITLASSIVEHGNASLYIPKDHRLLDGDEEGKTWCKSKSIDYGPKVDFENGQGWIRAYYEHKRFSPLTLGVEFSADLLEDWEGLDFSDGASDIYTCEDGPGTGTVAVPCCGHELVPIFPRSVLTTTWFRHVSVNINPIGHNPPGIYDIPHIDFHFWTQTSEERFAIPGVECVADMCDAGDGILFPMTCDDAFSLGQDLPDDQLASCYLNVRAVESKMSNHYAPVFCADEFKEGGKFSHTFVFPSCYGQLCGYEPMITKEYFEETVALEKNLCFDINMSDAAPEAGKYPTKYCMSYSPKTDIYKVYLTDFEDLPASNGKYSCPKN